MTLKALLDSKEFVSVHAYYVLKLPRNCYVHLPKTPVGNTIVDVEGPLGRVSRKNPASRQFEYQKFEDTEQLIIYGPKHSQMALRKYAMWVEKLVDGVYRGVEVRLQWALPGLKDKAKLIEGKKGIEIIGLTENVISISGRRGVEVSKPVKSGIIIKGYDLDAVCQTTMSIMEATRITKSEISSVTCKKATEKFKTLKDKPGSSAVNALVPFGPFYSDTKTKIVAAPSLTP